MRESLIIKTLKKKYKTESADVLLAAARCCSRLSWAGRKRVLQCAGIFPVTGNRQQIKKPEAHLSDTTSAFLYNRWSSCFCASHVRAAVLWLVLASNSLCYDLRRPESCCCVNTFYFFVLLMLWFFLSCFLWRKIIAPHMHGVKGCIMKWSTGL